MWKNIGCKPFKWKNIDYKTLNQSEIYAFKMTRRNTWKCTSGVNVNLVSKYLIILFVLTTSVQ